MAKKECKVFGCPLVANRTGLCWRHRAKPFKRTITKKLKPGTPDLIDTLFSMYIKLRDTDEYGNGVCPTSGEPIYYRWNLNRWESNCECSHWINRTRGIVRWDERNAFAQYAPENSGPKDGDPVKSEIYLRKRWGNEEVEELIRLKNLAFYLTQEFVDQKCASLKEEITKLRKTKMF